MNLEEFIKFSKESLQKERDADIIENKLILENSSPKDLQRKGLCLLKLKIARKYVGLFGRIVIILEHINEMPNHSFTNGDIVILNSSDENVTVTGVVSKISLNSISIAFEDDIDSLELDESLIYRCTKMTNDVTYRRLNKILNNLEKCPNILLDIAFGSIQKPCTSFQDNSVSNFFNENLDASQIDAVRFCLGQKEFAIVHGPPGTGKTTTIVEVIHQLTNRNLKVLVCAPSNIAVDNLVERLVANKEKKKCKLVRLGHPARLLPFIVKYSLDSMVSQSDESGIVKDVRSDINQNLSSLKSCRNKYDRSKIKDELRLLKKELKQRQEQVVRTILHESSIILGTLTSVSMDGPLGLLLRDQNKNMERLSEQFDVVVIDECSQALEISCWIGLLWAKKCILAGDHHQLPPTIITHGPEKKLLEVTLMERLISKFGNDQIIKMLTTQYRMHEQIMRWSSHKFYNDKLIAADSVKSHLLCHLPDVIETEETLEPLLLVDTAGCLLYESKSDDSVSKGNEGEALVVEAHVKSLFDSGLKQQDIAIIVPYNLQAEIIRLKIAKLYPMVETRTVDGFQGREKEAVILSFVRSNSEGEVGFLADYRRINVAVTRARRHLFIVCDTSTVCRNAFIKSLVDHVTENGCVRSAHEYIQNFEFSPLHNQKSSRQIKPNITTADDHQERYNTFDKILRDFNMDKTVEIYSFPSDINSHDRLLIHQISELLNLRHESRGEGAQRYIVVSKSDETRNLSIINDSKTTKISELAICNDQEINRTCTTKNLDILIDESKSPRHNIDLFSENSTDSLNIDLNRDFCDRSHCGLDEILNSSKDDDDDDHSYLNYDSENTLSGDLINDLKIDVNRDLSSNDVLFKGNKFTNISLSNIDYSVGNINNENSSEMPTRGLNSTLIKSTNVRNLLDSGDFKKCKFCGVDVPIRNIQLHDLHCKSRLNIKIESKVYAIAPKKNVVKNKSVVKNLKKSIDGDNFDELISSAIEANHRCLYTSCKSITTTVGQICQHCKMRFCLSHHLPEIHGCGEAERLLSRQRLIQDGVVRPGGGRPIKKSDVAKRERLKTILDKKLVTMEEGRKGKRGGKDAKK